LFHRPKASGLRAKARDTGRAMSQENVETIRRIDDAFRTGVERADFEVAWKTGAIAADVEWIAAPEIAEQRRYRGREGFVEFMRRWTEDFEGYSIQRETLIDAGDDRVLGIYRQSATGRGSGAPVELEYAVVFELQDGQLVRMRAYLDRTEALAAAGLRE
jgi:ketosteroid isomerase-like protein